MKIERILQGIREAQASDNAPAPAAPSSAQGEKTASAPAANVAGDKLRTALAAATPAPVPEKVAAEKASPVADVMKIASEIAETEKAAALKEAEMLGRAFADATISRIAEWQKTAAAMPAVTPVPVVASGTSVDEAMKLGYQQAVADMEKQANETYVQGYNDTVMEIHKTASAEFLKGAAATAKLLNSIQGAQQ